MITNYHLVEEFEREYRRNEHLTLEQKFAILDDLYELARQFGHFSDKNILDGIEHDIRLAQIMSDLATKNSQ
jgi:hypothetical protein